MNHAAIASMLGYGVMAVVGTLIVLALLLGGWWLTGLLGADVWKRLRRIYHLRVIAYWLDRIEKVGVREFEKAEAYDRAHPASIYMEATRLINRAVRERKVLTISLEPLDPLAMGNHRMLPEVRDARDTA